MDIRKFVYARLAKELGVKSISQDALEYLQELQEAELVEQIAQILLVHKHSPHKMITADTVCRAFYMSGENSLFVSPESDSA